MKVNFLVRNDFFSKFGGDTHQIQQYIDNMSDVHFKISTLNELDLSVDYDLYILTNTDRMYEYIEIYNQLKKKGLLNKTAILPIHHSFEAIQEYFIQTKPFLWKFIKPFGGVYFFEKLKGIFRSFKDKKPLCGIKHIFLNYKAILNESFLRTRFVIAIAQGEVDNIKVDFNISTEFKYYIIRNGVSKKFLKYLAATPLIERDIDVLVCGRVELRKNQLAIVNKLRRTNLNVTIIGAVNKNNNYYSEKFFDGIRGCGNISYIEAVTPDKIVEYFARAKVSLSASWFEVSSLVDIEAYAAGCYVISSCNGHSTEIIPKNKICIVDPKLDVDLEGLIQSKLENTKNQTFNASDEGFNLTWEYAGSELYHVFKKEITRINC